MRVSRDQRSVLVDVEQLARWADAHPGGGWQHGMAMTATFHSPAWLTLSATRWGMPWRLDFVDTWALEELAQHLLSITSTKP